MLNSDGMRCVDTVRLFKSALLAFQEFISQNGIVASAFMDESQGLVPARIITNREILGALLNNVLQVALSTTKQQGIGIYVSWKPKSVTLASAAVKEDKQEPFFVMNPGRMST